MLTRARRYGIHVCITKAFVNKLLYEWHLRGVVVVSFLCSSTNAKFEVESSTLVAEGEPVCAVIMASIVMFLSCHVCMIAESVCMCVGTL